MAEALWETNAADWYCLSLGSRSNDISRLQSESAIKIYFDRPNEVIQWCRELKPWFGWVCNEHELKAIAEFGHLLPLFQVDGVNAGYMKIAFHQVYLTDFKRRIALPPDTAFAYEIFVHPTFRDRGIATALVKQSLNYLQQQNYQFVWCHIPSWNQASIQTFLKCNFSRMGYNRYFRLFRWHAHTHSPVKMLAR